MRSRHLPFFFSLSVPLLGFILILVSLNLYQYFKAKQNIASASLFELSNIEINKVQTFFNTVSNRLNVVREWGKNEEFYIRSGPSNTKLSPSRIISYLEKNR